MIVEVQKALVIGRIYQDKWFPPIFAVVGLVPDGLGERTAYMFPADNIKKIYFEIEKFPTTAGLFIPDILELGIIEKIDPFIYVHINNLEEKIKRIPWKKESLLREQVR